MPGGYTALLIDDEQHALDLLKNLLEETGVFSDILITTHPEEALQIFRNEHPDVLFLDIEMPLLSGFDLLEKMNGEATNTEVVFVTAHSDYALKAIQKACMSYVLKPPDLHDIESILHRLRERTFADTHLQKICYKKITFYQKNYPAFNTLTDRERETLRFMTEGLTNKQIGKELNISSLTVKTHRQNIFRKLGTTNQGELFQFVEVFMEL